MLITCKVLLPSIVLVCIGLGACSIKEREEDEPQNEAQVLFATEPASEKAFRTDLINLYEDAKGQYDGAPNDVARTQVRDQWDKDFCSFLAKRLTFIGWKGRLDELSQPNVVVIFNINIGYGMKLVNDSWNDLSLDSPAYKIISQVSPGSEVTVSGKFAPPLMGDCNTPSMPLNGDVSDIQFEVVLTEFNGASTLAPNTADNESGNE